MVTKMSDGGLRKLFQDHLHTDVHWQAIETWSTGQGVPDLNYCFKRCREGWIENKLTAGYAVDISPQQIAWVERRARMGGRVFVAVRRKNEGRPRRGEPVDELILFTGAHVRSLATLGTNAAPFTGRWAGGRSEERRVGKECRSRWSPYH